VLASIRQVTSRLLAKLEKKRMAQPGDPFLRPSAALRVWLAVTPTSREMAYQNAPRRVYLCEADSAVVPLNPVANLEIWVPTALLIHTIRRVSIMELGTSTQ
jgi:hypothetical protein